MARKNIILMIVTVLVGLGIMAGVVLFLRFRNAATGQEVQLQQPAKSAAAGKQPAGNNQAFPVTHLKDLPKVGAWKEGDPEPSYPTSTPVYDQ